MSALCWRKAFHFVGERVQTHRAIVEGDVPVGVFPGNGMLEPILVIALLKVIARMCASRFRAGNGGMSNDDGLLRQIGKLESRDQRDVPLQRGIIDRNALQWPKPDCIASCISGRISPGLLPPLLWRVRSKRDSAASCE